MTGSGIDGATLSTRRQLGGRWELALDPAHPNFPSSDAAFGYALSHGFCQLYYSRPKGFIDLRLSPATRRYLRGKSDKEIWTLLPRILGVSERDQYFYAVRVKDYMEETRSRWLAAVRVMCGSRHPSMISSHKCIAA